MEKISRHISQTIEAPFLDTSVTWNAVLWCEDKPEQDIKTVGVVEELDEENSCVTFTFSGIQIDKFEDGDKLNLTVYNAEHTQDYRLKNMYKVVESHVPHEADVVAIVVQENKLQRWPDKDRVESTLYRFAWSNGGLTAWSETKLPNVGDTVEMNGEEEIIEEVIENE